MFHFMVTSLEWPMTFDKIILHYPFLILEREIFSFLNYRLFRLQLKAKGGKMSMTIFYQVSR